MTISRDSTDAGGSSDGTTSRPDEENSPLPGDSRGRELARDHLEDALDEAAPSEKNYHIRSALQTLVIAEENSPE